MNYRQMKYNQGQAAREEIYRFLVKYFQQHGYAPAYEEIMDGTGFTKMHYSTSYAAIRDGFFNCHGTSRNIKGISLNRISVHRKGKTWEAN